VTYRIVPRTEIGLPAVVTNSNGTPRPPLDYEPYITAHYTGNNVDYTDKVTREVVLQIQRVFSKTKPFEYNYVIGQAEDNHIYEFAGKYQAAHSGGENHIAFGVLFLLGVGEEPTPLMIDKWKWLRDVLIFDGSLMPNVMQRMHKDMPYAATACPGGIIPHWPKFLTPWVAPDEGEDEMKPENCYIAKPPAGIAGYGANPPWFLVEKFGGGVRYAMNEDASNPLIKHVPTNQEQYKNLHRSVYGV
jgi:hypothetical protein